MPVKKRKHPNGGPQRRHITPTRGVSRRLDADHPAIRESRTLFPTTVVHASLSPRLLIGGHNQRKIGKRVVKGRWAGMPLYTLTLEERATCPSTCTEWLTCYGNNMHFARRHIAGEALEDRLWQELKQLDAMHPAGFVVRLHILGDFYSEAYVDLWAHALERFTALRVFGFTARDPDACEIGSAVYAMNVAEPDRCRIRFSGAALGGMGSLVIETRDESSHVACPAQHGATDCCATCGLCWTMDRVVEFVRH